MEPATVSGDTEGVDAFRFVERVLTTLLRVTMWSLRAVWRFCASLAELIVPKGVPGLRLIVTTIFFVGAAMALAQLVQ